MKRSNTQKRRPIMTRDLRSYERSMALAKNLAELLGYKDKSSISRLESGERSINPRQELLIKQALNEEK